LHKVYPQPALVKAGWDTLTQIREEVSFTNGRIYVKGNLTSRGKQKRADYILYYKPNIPIAVIEAKSNKLSLNAGIQQGLDYAKRNSRRFKGSRFKGSGNLIFLFHIF